MNRKLRGFSSALVLLVSMSLLLTGCDKLGLSASSKSLEVPTMAPAAAGVELSRDNKGLTEADHQYLAYAKEKLTNLDKGLETFGQKMSSYVDDIMKTAKDVEEYGDYVKTRNNLLEIAAQIEAVDPAQSPEAFKEVYNKLDLCANRVRHMLMQIEDKNATNLPAIYDTTKAEIQPFKEALDQFFAQVDSQGLDVAAANMPPTDWAAETERHDNLDLRNTMNVADYGLKWGSSRWQVMGVEGMQEGGASAETLSYNKVAYQYNAVLTYHFNEYGQLDSYTFDFDPASFNRGNNEDPVLDDVIELSAIVMYYFINDSPAIPQQPVFDGVNGYTVSFDPPAEHVLLSGNPDSLTLVVKGKTADEANPQ